MAISWFKKKRIIHPVQEEFFSEDAWNRFRSMILRRRIHNRRRTTSRRIKIEPKLSRFWLESQGRLIPPPIPPAPVPVEPCRSLTHRFLSKCSFIGLDPLLPLTHSEDRKLATFQLIRSEPVPFFGISEILKSFQGASTDSVRLRKPKYEGLFQILQSLIQLFKHAFGDLSFLVSIDLSLNNFHGELPSEFSHLRRLGEVDLSYNFTGEIPTGLATLPRLKRLSFGFDESLNGSNVLSILSISTLEYLDLGNAGLTGDIPSDLCHHVPRMQALGLDSNLLEELHLSESNLQEAFTWWKQNKWFVHLGGLQKLIQLSLAHNSIQGSILETFGELIELNALDLLYSNMSGVIPKSLEALKKLDFLNISFNRDCLSNSFRVDETLSRSFGSVYKGTLADGMTVAAKVFYVQMEGAFQTFDRECEIFVTEISPKSLAAVKLNIMFDVASALEFLHHGYSVPVIHCDLKPSKMLAMNCMSKYIFRLKG
ncbi:hypothetical protein RDI58_004932 [Solanum bulbocastanum]|uniref:Protein kinase domain-containing protein n=1 Tax=Solanum bulbocastanum TaxID=147425 RepID=A0AAN8YLX6_SOLBU